MPSLWKIELLALTAIASTIFFAVRVFIIFGLGDEIGRKKSNWLAVVVFILLFNVPNLMILLPFFPNIENIHRFFSGVMIAVSWGLLMPSVSFFMERFSKLGQIVLWFLSLVNIWICIVKL